MTARVESGRSTTPIAAADLVGAVLERDMALIDVFVRHSPHFEKLRNPVLRRTMARLVTVEQAAAIAGVPAAALVQDLNAALGLDVRAAEPPEAAGLPTVTRAAASRPVGLREVELDLRDDLREGREPFSRIMQAVGTLGDDEVLRLRTIFEPVPLYTVLGKRGFSHEAHAHSSDDWSVWFWRGGRDVAERVVDASRPDDARLEASAEFPDRRPDETWLDVRGLEPPEPMVRTLAALEALQPDRTLVQVNVRVPQFLLPILAERGFVAEVDDTRPDRVLVRIRRRS